MPLQRALEQSRLDSAETERIMTIISRVLSVGKDQPTIMTYLNATLTPYISRLSHLKDLMVSMCSLIFNLTMRTDRPEKQRKKNTRYSLSHTKNS